VNQPDLLRAFRRLGRGPSAAGRETAALTGVILAARPGRFGRTARESAGTGSPPPPIANAGRELDRTSARPHNPNGPNRCTRASARASAATAYTSKPACGARMAVELVNDGPVTILDG
jgi:hypothetical protein